MHTADISLGRPLHPTFILCLTSAVRQSYTVYIIRTEGRHSGMTTLSQNDLMLSSLQYQFKKALKQSIQVTRSVWVWTPAGGGIDENPTIYQVSLVFYLIFFMMQRDNLSLIYTNARVSTYIMYVCYRTIGIDKVKCNLSTF